VALDSGAPGQRGRFVARADGGKEMYIRPNEMIALIIDSGYPLCMKSMIG
jgi:hypothetical protein